MAEFGVGSLFPRTGGNIPAMTSARARKTTELRRDRKQISNEYVRPFYFKRS